GGRDPGRVFGRPTPPPSPPRVGRVAPAWDAPLTGDDVDLPRLPIPVMHEKDGGPYLTSGVVVARDAEFGRNAGVYRLMYRGPRHTSIDMVSHSDLRTFYRRSLERREAAAVGTPPRAPPHGPVGRGR